MSDTQNAPATPEIDAAKAHAAALDSVAIVNELSALITLTDEQKARLWANAKHLEIMVDRNVFTKEQNTALSASVKKGGKLVDLSGPQPEFNRSPV